MTDNSNVLKKTVFLIIGPLISLGVIIWFWPSRWIRHNIFLYRLKNPRLKPSIISLPFVYASLGSGVIRKEFRRRFSQYSLKKYEDFIRGHYSTKGYGYFNFASMNDSERIEVYNRQKGRILYFISHNKSLIPYKDGDSFLDAGCGSGQNIKTLTECFPGSKIQGFDISEEAVRVINTGTENNPNVHVSTGDISDLDYLGAIPGSSVDHIILSHVIGFLSKSDVEQTVVFRQQLIDHLVRICSSSVIILDKIEDIPDIWVEIEQNTRCIVHDRIMNYFSKHTDNGGGEMYVMFSDESSGVLFLKKQE